MMCLASNMLTDWFLFYYYYKLLCCGNFAWHLRLALYDAGLNHENNMKKMRLLTFLQMAETRKEMDFAHIQEELLLGPQAVEEFVIDGG